MIHKSDRSFEEVLNRINMDELSQLFDKIGPEDVKKAMDLAATEKRLSVSQLAALLSPAAAPYIEEMAQISSKLTLKYFGRAVMLYLPIYISNYCENRCVYCGFSAGNSVKRRQLSLEDIEKESKAIAKEGEVKHILVLTGEAPKKAGLDYISDAVEILKRHFSSVSIEVYPMTTDEYATLGKIGVDGVTVYQETYNRERYAELHPSGKKRDFNYRLNAPQRGAEAGLRSVGIGALYGLSDCRMDAFLTALHGRYLSDRFLNVEFSLSLPRITPAAGGFQSENLMDDALFVQVLLAFRLFLPRLGINVSTREQASFRDNLLGIGLTRMSAGSRTSVGGYDQSDPSEDQFSIGDTRSVGEVITDLKRQGYQPVHKDWELLV